MQKQRVNVKNSQFSFVEDKHNCDDDTKTRQPKFFPNEAQLAKLSTATQKALDKKK